MIIEIRDATQPEAKLLSDLAFRSKAYWGYSDEFMEQAREELSVSSANIGSKNFQYLVAELKNEIVGFYGLERLSQKEFELDALFVAPEHIGAGVGRTLMNHAINRATQLGAQILIIQSDPNAEKFYRAAGGVVTGTKESLSIPGRYLPMLEITLTGKNEE